MRKCRYRVSRQSRARQPTFQGPVGHIGLHGTPISATRSREPSIESPVEGVSLHGFGERAAERRREGGEGLGGLGWPLAARPAAGMAAVGMAVAAKVVGGYDYLRRWLLLGTAVGGTTGRGDGRWWGRPLAGTVRTVSPPRGWTGCRRGGGRCGSACSRFRRRGCTAGRSGGGTPWGRRPSGRSRRHRDRG